MVDYGRMETEYVGYWAPVVDHNDLVLQIGVVAVPVIVLEHTAVVVLVVVAYTAVDSGIGEEDSSAGYDVECLLGRSIGEAVFLLLLEEI